MIVISENDVPRVVDGFVVKRGKLDGKTVYVALRDGAAGWGLTAKEAISACDSPP